MDSQICGRVPPPGDRAGPFSRQTRRRIREGAWLDKLDDCLIMPGILLVFQVGPPVRQKDRPAAVADEHFLTLQRMSVDTGERVRERNGV